MTTLLALKTGNYRTEQIDITPDTSMLPKSGKTGYSLPQAIAELVDNSIDARSSNEALEVRVVIQSDYISVKDNGLGMDRSTARNALVLGYSEKKDQLGEFGIGMKAACTSLGKKFNVKTSRKGIKDEYLYSYDEDSWLSKRKRSDWTDLIKIIDKENVDEHGTLIEIEDLTRRVSSARKKDVVNDLSARFAPFLLSGEVKIFVNNSECIPKEPELSEEKKDFQIILPCGNKIYGWYGLLKHGSNRGLYGFNTFRRGRMITSYDKLGIPYHPTVSKIIGEIYMDHVPVSSNKKGWEQESDEYKEAEVLLKKEFMEIVAKARESSMSEKIDKDVLEKTELWKAEMVKVVKTENLLENVSKNHVRKKVNDESAPQGLVAIETRDSKLDHLHEEIKAKNERFRFPRKNRPVISHFIIIEGKSYNIRHEYASLGKERGWKDIYFRSEKPGEPIVIYTNKDFPAYAATSDIPFYAALHIAEALGEIIAKANGEGLDKADEYKELVLRKSSQIIDEFN